MGLRFVNENADTSGMPSDIEEGSEGKGPASERISQCMYFKVAQEKWGTELLDDKAGALYWAKVKDFRLAE